MNMERVKIASAAFIVIFSWFEERRKKNYKTLSLGDTSAEK
jgi:hypothetical protein